MISQDPKVKYVRVKNNLEFCKYVAKIAGEEATHSIIDRWAEKLGTAEKIFLFVRDNIQYIRDPIIMDTIRRPHVLLERYEKGEKVAGDCDCKTALLGALLLNRGYPVRFVASHIIKGDETKAQRSVINHIYLEYRNIYGKEPNKWIPLEASSKRKFSIGYQSPAVLPLYRIYVVVGKETIKKEV